MAWDRLRASYDTVAATYEATFVDELAGKSADRERLAALAASVDGAGVILDLGCGPGQIGAAVAAAGRVVRGVDLSPRMAARARRRLGGAVAGDLRDLPIASGSVDGVVAFYALIHLRRSEQDQAWREIARVLRPGGRALLTAHEGEGLVETDDFLAAGVPFVATLLTLDEMRSSATAAGLTVEHADRREPYATEHPTVRLTIEVVRPG